ncbi:hypothetical protein B0H14DRAFT_2944953 [Mycena olivaceomarginata]|nr:hypothetical protein B0H14DRAFT_2944953 [Mycena olivaceomarginata]
MNDAATPQEDADRIRLKRLAKLQGAASSSSNYFTHRLLQHLRLNLSRPKPPVSTPPLKRLAETPPPVSSVKKKTLLPLDVNAWEHETIGHVFHVTLDRKVAEQSGYDIVWLKTWRMSLKLRSHVHIIDRLLIARLELDPSNMTDDLDFLPVLASNLVGCWETLNSARSCFNEEENALTRLEKVRELIVSYTGLTLQEPEMFPQPSGLPTSGPSPNLVAPLLSLSALSAPLLGFFILISKHPHPTPSDIDVFLQDLTRRFEPDNEIDDVLGPVVRQLLFQRNLCSDQRASEGGDAGLARGDFNPANATAATFEQVSLLGPLCRLGIFAREWPGIAMGSRDDIDSSNASLRGTLKSLQSSLFQVFNTLVRASAESREAVLEYLLDQLHVNLQAFYYSFAEPFMDANYTKMDRIDPLFYARSKRD